MDNDFDRNLENLNMKTGSIKVGEDCVIDSNETLTENGRRPPRGGLINDGKNVDSDLVNSSIIKSAYDESNSRLSMLSSTSTERNFQQFPTIITTTPINTSLLEKRRQIVNEILETETRYVNDLLYLKNEFITPLLAASGTVQEIISKRLEIVLIQGPFMTFSPFMKESWRPMPKSKPASKLDCPNGMNPKELIVSETSF